MAEKQSAPEKPVEDKPVKEKKRRVPILPIIAIVVVLNVLLVGKIYMGRVAKKSPAESSKIKKEEPVGVKVPLEEFLVNLAGSSEHYLKATFAIGLRKGETEESIKEEVAPIRDAILSVLTSKQADELATESGKEKLKKDMVGKINKEIGGEKVLKVYFMSFATQ